VVLNDFNLPLSGHLNGTAKAIFFYKKCEEIKQDLLLQTIVLNSATNFSTPIYINRVDVVIFRAS
jgi:hypothetical protein